MCFDLSLFLSTAVDGCHCSTLRERDFPRYPLPTILLYATSAMSSRPPSVSFSPAHRGMPTFYSTIFLSCTRTKQRRQEVVVEVDGSALRPPRTPTRARTGGFRRIGRYFGAGTLPWGYRYSSKTGEDLSFRRKFYGILFKLAKLHHSSGF